MRAWKARKEWEGGGAELGTSWNRAVGDLPPRGKGMAGGFPVTELRVSLPLPNALLLIGRADRPTCCLCHAPARSNIALGVTPSAGAIQNGVRGLVLNKPRLHDMTETENTPEMASDSPLPINTRTYPVRLYRIALWLDGDLSRRQPHPRRPCPHIAAFVCGQPTRTTTHTPIQVPF